MEMEEMLSEDLKQQVNIESFEPYYNSILNGLKEEYLFEDEPRKLYIKNFSESQIQRNTINSLELVINLLPIYKRFLQNDLTPKLIKVFLEEQVDFYVWSTKGAIKKQDTNDKKILSFAIILKFLRMYNPNGQILFECMIAFLYDKLGCLFKNQDQFKLPQYQSYIKMGFWKDGKWDQEGPDLTQIKIISIIRKLSCLMWALLWIDPNEIIWALPEEFKELKPTFTYTFLNEDRQLFNFFISLFVKCKNYSIIPALSSLYDIVNEKALLLKIFDKFADIIEQPTIKHQNLETSPLLIRLDPQLFKLAHKEFYEYPYMYDNGMIQIVKTKYRILQGKEDKIDYNFYEKQFKNDQDERLEFYSK